MNEKFNAPRFYYDFSAYRNGKLIWTDSFYNTVALLGKNDLLDKYFAGSAYTATWYLGLIDSINYTTGPVEADTMISHTGWQENIAYTEANRQTLSWSAASSKSKSTSSPCSFTINANSVINGGFIVSNNTKGGTGGILYSGGVFQTGARSLISGDVLRINLTVSVG